MKALPCTLRCTEMATVFQDRIIGFGWIPNISGHATSTDNLEKCIGFSGHDSGVSLVSEITEDEYFVSVAVVSEGYRIIPIDEHGLCLIGTDQESGKQLTDVPENRYFVFSVRRTWRYLCEQLCECDSRFAVNTAPLPLTDRDIYRGVVESLLKKSENASAFGASNSSLRARIFRSMEVDAFQRSIIGYANRYLDIYEDMIGRDLDDYRSQAVCRMGMNDISITDVERRYRIRANDAMKVIGYLTLATTLLISLADYLKP